MDSNVFYLFDDYKEHYLGSSTAYNDWRDILAKESGYEKSEFTKRTPYLATAFRLEQGPHSLLLNFTDADGTICNCRCRAIYDELVLFEDKAKELGDFFMQRYLKKCEIFGFARENGVVHFKQ